jgi:hypothetical protein
VAEAFLACASRMVGKPGTKAFFSQANQNVEEQLHRHNLVTQRAFILLLIISLRNRYHHAKS